MENKLETISNLFEGKEIRSHWNIDEEEYYFSVVDVIVYLCFFISFVLPCAFVAVEFACKFFFIFVN